MDGLAGLAAVNAISRGWPVLRAHVISELDCHFITLSDRRDAVEAGGLPAVRDLEDSRVARQVMDASDPRHPDNRERRMKGADLARLLAAARPDLILGEFEVLGLHGWTDEERNSILDELLVGRLHRSATDECAAVRLAIAQTLGWLAQPASIATLEQLVSVDDESENAVEAAREALAVIRGDVNRSDTVWIDHPCVL